ncbi:MAG TPA: hypothetical protein VMZ06_00540 [Candidatus Bathyarchaeia archaeon]|nr:hypothetical protein [Candidatus Bathyarchaeia archaeon]
MGCCLGILALLFPRGTLAIMWLVGYTSTAFETYLWPLLGFIFLPYTTCAYAIAMNAMGGTRGLGLVLVVIGVLLDLGTHGGSARSGGRYRHRVVN